MPCSACRVPAAQSAGLRRGLARLFLEHRHQLRHQYQLAGLWRRDHHELPDPDAGADHPELPLGCHRHGRSDCLDPWHYAPHCQHHRQLLGGSDPHGAIYSAALAFVLSLVLVSQGVVQTFSQYKTADLLQPTTYQQAKTDANGNPVKDASGNPVMVTVQQTQQVLAVGPAASQIAIKQLGTNGGGFFNANSAHPFENSTPLSNFLETLSLLLIPAALCYTFGKMVGDTRQGWAILAAMTIIFVVLLAGTVWAEQTGNPAIASLGVDIKQSNINPGGNMEGKDERFGVAESALWDSATTAAFQRFGQLDARLEHAAGRDDSFVGVALRGGALWRGRLRTVRHAGLCHRGGLRGRADGRAHP